VAALVAETVVGAAAGCVPAVPGYSRRFPEISDRYRVLLVLDEIIGRRRHRPGFAGIVAGHGRTMQADFSSSASSASPPRPLR